VAVATTNYKEVALPPPPLVSSLPNRSFSLPFSSVLACTKREAATCGDRRKGEGATVKHFTGTRTRKRVSMPPSSGLAMVPLPPELKKETARRHCLLARWLGFFQHGIKWKADGGDGSGRALGRTPLHSDLVF
jgi:hypothetical protein